MHGSAAPRSNVDTFASDAPCASSSDDGTQTGREEVLEMYEHPVGKRDSTSCAARYGATCILLVACAFSSACATVINGATQRVAVTSDPPGAQLFINDAPVGVTPAFVDIPRRDADLELRFEKDGCDPAVLTLERSGSWWSAANVLLAGVPINDYSTGAWMGSMVFYGVLGALEDARSGGAYKRPDSVRAALASTAAGEGHCRTDEDRGRAALSGGNAPRYTGPRPGNRLVPVQHVHGVHRVIGQRSDWLPRQD